MTAHCVIGSGPAGVACAAALLKRGCEVTMLDAGIGLEESKLRAIEQIKATDRAAWDPNVLAAIKGSTRSSAKGIPLKYSYGSDFPYREVEEALGCRFDGVALRPSFASGGFSNVWGAAMLPYAESDLRGWPIDGAQLAPHYAAAVELTGLAARRDDLEEMFPMFAVNPPPLDFSQQAQILLRNLERNKDTLRKHGVRFGASRLAVKAARGPGHDGCVYCGLCMYGCPWGYIYNSAATVERLRANAAFRYTRDIVVERVTESPSGARIHARHRVTREPFTVDAERVYLAAGVIPTTRILLESLEAYDRTLWIKDSQYFLFPLALMKKAKDVRRESLHTLSQLFVEILDKRISEHVIHLQLYAYNELIGDALRGALGPLSADFLVRELESRLMIVQGYLHSDLSARIAVTLTRGRNGGELVLRGETQPATKPAIRAVIGKLLRLAPRTRALPLPPMLQIAEPGRGFHSGGSFPMRENPGPFETDVLGRPHGFQRVHVVDATVFPTIPATTITLSAMANAHRIGSAV
jgi:choline dehydrogenase-like flavoprotein